LLLDVDVRVRDAFLAALEKLIIADDVTLEAPAEPVTLLGLEGPAAARLLGPDAAALPAWAHATISLAGVAVRALRASEVRGPGFVLHVPAAAAVEVWSALAAAGARPCGMEALEGRRIEVGVPRVGLDMDASTLALEVPVEEAISQTKGCYLGQEVVARGTARGHVNRRLMGLVFAGAAPAPGAALLHDGKTVGRVTSVAHAFGLGAPAGLGFVRREHWEPGTVLAAGSVTARVARWPLACGERRGFATGAHAHAARKAIRVRDLWDRGPVQQAGKRNARVLRARDEAQGGEAASVLGLTPRAWLFENGRVLTLDPRCPTAAALAVRGGRVLAVGSLGAVRERAGRAAERIDCRGAAVLPGIVDPHLHLFALAARDAHLDCAAFDDVRALLAAVAARARALAPGQWVRGDGLDEARLGRLPTAAELDAAAPHNPVRLRHRSRHASVLSGAALARLGIAAETGLVAEREEAIGRLVGPLPPDVLARGLAAAARALARLGVTTVADATPRRRAALAPLRAAIDKGEFPLRVFA